MLLREWLAQLAKRITHRVDVAKDTTALTFIGRCRHATHQEMLAARSHCPDCRRRYVRWAVNVGLEFDPERDGAFSQWARRGRSEWND